MPKKDAIILLVAIAILGISIFGGRFVYKAINTTPFGKTWYERNYIIDTGLSLKKLKISSPTQGAVVKEGEKLLVKVEPPQDFEVQGGIKLVSDTGIYLEDKETPYEFEIQVPYNQDVGRFTLTATAQGAIGKIDLQIEPSVDFISLIVEPKTITLDNPYSITEPFYQQAFQVRAIFADGKERNIALSSKTIYMSQDESVAIISTKDERGAFWASPFVRGLKPGKTKVVVSFANKSFEIPVEIKHTNHKPVAEIKSDRQGSFVDLPPVKVGETVMIDGSKSYDPDGDPLTYEWNMAAPEGSKAVVLDSDKPIARVIPDKPGHYAGGFFVKDNHGGVDVRDWDFNAK